MSKQSTERKKEIEDLQNVIRETLASIDVGQKTESPPATKKQESP